MKIFIIGMLMLCFFFPLFTLAKKEPTDLSPKQMATIRFMFQSLPVLLILAISYLLSNMISQ